MRLSKEKIEICRARKCYTIADLAKAYGVTRTRMNNILNQRESTTIVAGRLAKALEVDIEDIIE